MVRSGAEGTAHNHMHVYIYISTYTYVSPTARASAAAGNWRGGDAFWGQGDRKFLFGVPLRHWTNSTAGLFWSC